MNVAAATVYKVSRNIVLNSRFYLTEKHNAFLKIQGFLGVLTLYLPLNSSDVLKDRITFIFRAKPYIYFGLLEPENDGIPHYTALFN